jgi:hypothetical protein
MLQTETKTKRTDSDLLLRELKLSFGGKEYRVPVLRMREAAKWREEYCKRTQKVAESMPMNVDEKSPDFGKAVGTALFHALLQFPEAIPELVFSYAPLLPKEEIMANAYDDEFTIAFRAIWGVAFQPFLASLGMALETGRSQSPSPSSDVLN